MHNMQNIIFAFTKMTDRVKQILDFVNSDSFKVPAAEQEQTTEQDQNATEQDQTAGAEQEEITDDEDYTTSERKPKKTTRSTRKEEPTGADPDNDYDETTVYKNEKAYKSLMRKINNTMGKNSYPVVINSTVINSPEEMALYKNELMTNRRQYTREKRNTAITNTKLNLNHLDKIEDLSEYVEDENALYKRKSIDAIKKDGVIYKVPKTSKKDTNRIYKHVGKNKDVIKQLITSKDNDEFNAITEKNITDDQVKRVYETHRDNDLTRDRTWTKDDFIKFMEKIREDEEKQKQKHKKPLDLPKPPNPLTPGSGFIPNPNPSGILNHVNSFTDAERNPYRSAYTPMGLNPRLFMK